MSKNSKSDRTISTGYSRADVEHPNISDHLKSYLDRKLFLRIIGVNNRKALTEKSKPGETDREARGID